MKEDTNAWSSLNWWGGRGQTFLNQRHILVLDNRAFLNIMMYFNAFKNTKPDRVGTGMGNLVDCQLFVAIFKWFGQNWIKQKPWAQRLSGYVGFKFWKFHLQLVLRVAREPAMVPSVSLWWHPGKPGRRWPLPSSFGHLRPKGLKEHGPFIIKLYKTTKAHKNAFSALGDFLCSIVLLVTVGLFFLTKHLKTREVW